MHTSVFPQPILLAGMDGGVLAQVMGTIRGLTNSNWKPRFLEPGESVPKGTVLLVSCSRETPTPGNFARILPEEARARQEELERLGVHIEPGLANHPGPVVLVKRPRDGSETYSGKPYAAFTNSLKGALQVPREKVGVNWRIQRGKKRRRDLGQFVVGGCYTPQMTL